MEPGDEDEDETETADERSEARRSRTPSAKLATDRYQVRARLGRGGMGEVLAARDEQIGREVAIKRMRAQRPSEQQVRRFTREARIQGRLDHPAVAPVYELGRDTAGLPFFVMKKLAGTTLAAILRGGEDARFPRQRLMRAFAEVCLAIEYAHVHGVIHRDLKPENIMLGDFGEVYVLDWGIAKVLGEADDTFGELRAEASGTLAGAIVGSVGFMPPEQARGDSDVDARADVFALGRVLAALLGRDGDPPPELSAVVTAATADARDDRLASARELGDRVQRYLDGDRDLALRARLARDHLETAREAFARGDRPADAIREAGRALALDPQLPGAAELVSRLMLEPPRELPPDVELATRKGDLQVQLDTARTARWAYLGYLALVPVLVAAGAPAYGGVLAALVVAAALFTYVEVGGRWVAPSWIVLAQVPILALLSWLYSPYVAGAVAALAGFIVATNPLLRTRRGAVAMYATLVAAVASPLVAERAGLVPATFTVEAGGFAQHSVGLGHTPAIGWTLLAFYVLALIMYGILFGRVMRQSERTLRHRLQVQTWQLAQLVPNAPPTSSPAAAATAPR